MPSKRLRSGKSISTETVANLSLSAKEQMTAAVHKQFIETMKLPAEFSDVSEKINGECYSMLRIGHDMNEYCEIISGSGIFNNVKTEVIGSLFDLCERSKIHFSRKNIALIFKPKLEKVFVKIDRERFYYAVLNLLLNAAENTPDGGKVILVVSKTAKFVKITVNDNGFGMDEETLKHCSEPFFSAEGNFGKRKMGLGLTLAHHFSYESGGRMHISSEKGKGTSASVLLPLLSPEEEKLSAEALVPDILGGKYSPVMIMLSGIGKE